MTNKSMVVQLSSNDGFFSVDHNKTFFFEHETTKSMKENVQHIKKAVAKLVKTSEVTIDILSMDENYKRTDEVRIICNISDWSESYTVDFRKFNGYDFSNSTVFNFVSTTDLVKFVYSKLTLYTDVIMSSLPEDKSLFAQSLDRECKVEEIM